MKIQIIKILRSLAFWNLVVLMAVMAWATFLEKDHGSDYAYERVYGTWWFVALWASLVMLALVGIIKGKIYRNVPLLMIHISLMVILTGALCTRLFALQGYVILRQGIPESKVQTDMGLKTLPFSMELDTFYVVYYQGTDSPSDYVSHFHMTDESGDVISAKVSMNNIAGYAGYRFYQSSYEPDGKTSVLSINRDICGIPLSYAGYALFVLSMLWYLLSPRNPFRQLLKHPLLRNVAVLLLVLSPLSVFASPLTPDSLTVNRKQAEHLGGLYMSYDGRVTSVSVFAHDFTLKLTGKSSFGYMNSEQFLAGLLFFPEKWQRVALFDVRDATLKKELDSPEGKAALRDFFDRDGVYRLGKYSGKFTSRAKLSPKLKEVEKLNEQVQLISMLHSGALLQLFPYRRMDGVKGWIQPLQPVPGELAAADSLFITSVLPEYYNALLSGAEQKADSLLTTISEYQQRQAGDILPAASKRDTEIFYLKADFTSWLYRINLMSGFLSLLFLFFLSGRVYGKIQPLFYGLLLLSFAVHTFSIVLRAYVAGRLPVSNGFETMLTIAWCAMLPALFFRKRFSMILPFGLLISGFALLVAQLGMSNPKITHLMPVLSSPLLSIHVSVIMLAYTLLAFVALNSLVSLWQVILIKDERSAVATFERNKIFSLICLYPTLLFLGAGIFIGAVWANVSWGRYWGWDPKEVWALITLLVYGLALHRKLPFISGVFGFHVFGLLAFSSVLMTFFGVNYIIGGMHSYAGNMDMSGVRVAIAAAIVAMLLITGWSYKQYSRKKSILVKTS